jgi:hypothetical protein
MFEKTFGITATVPLGVFELSADLRTALIEPEKFNRCELPVNTGVRRGW